MSKKLLIKTLDMLTYGTVNVTSEKLKLAANDIHRESRYWMNENGIQGIGIGKREKDSVMMPNLVIKVYVEKKLPKSQVQKLVPKSLWFPGFEEKIDLDVVEIGKVNLHMNTNRIRPVLPGFSIGHTDISAGTLGCLVRKNGVQNELYILSSSHVLANHGLGSKGDSIVQPGKKDGGSHPIDKIAELSEWIPFDFNDNANTNMVDAAIARVIDKNTVKEVIRKIGIPTGINKNPRLDMIIKKTGRTTDFTCGTIRDVNFRVQIPYKMSKNQMKKVWMYDQVLCTRYGDLGDSGSILVTTNGKVVGLHMAGSPSTSIFNKINNVIKALDINIVTTI